MKNIYYLCINCYGCVLNIPCYFLPAGVFFYQNRLINYLYI